MSKASPPRTSPTTSRSGRIRSAARTSSRTLTAPAPSAFAGARLEPNDVRMTEPKLRGLLDRDDPLTAGRSPAPARSRRWSCPRSSRPRHDDVPSGAAPSSRGTRPQLRRARSRRARPHVTENRRIVTHGPSGASGGSTACNRDPSARRASTIGAARSSRRPSGAITRCVMRRIASASSSQATALEAAAALDEHPVRPVHHDLVDRRVREQRLQRSEPVDLGDELVENAARRCVARERGLRRGAEHRARVRSSPGASMRRIERRGEQPPLQDVAQRPALENRLVGHAASSRPRQPIRRSTSRTGRASASGSRVGSTPASIGACGRRRGSRRSRGSGRRARS